MSSTVRSLIPIQLFLVAVIGLGATFLHVDRCDAYGAAATSPAHHADRPPLGYVFGR